MSAIIECVQMMFVETFAAAPTFSIDDNEDAVDDAFDDTDKFGADFKFDDVDVWFCWENQFGKAGFLLIAYMVHR